MWSASARIGASKSRSRAIGVQNRLIRIDRMWPASFAKATDEHRIRRFEKPQSRCLDSRLFLISAKISGKSLQIPPSRTSMTTAALVYSIFGLEDQIVELVEAARRGRLSTQIVSTVLQAPVRNVPLPEPLSR